MKKTMRMLLALALMVLMLCACGANEPEPTVDPNLEVLDFSLLANSAADLDALAVYENLQTLDLRGSSCYEAIESYVSEHR